MSMKNLLTPAGIEPATFRFVAQQGLYNHSSTETRGGHKTGDVTCNLTLGRVRVTIFAVEKQYYVF